MTLPLLDPSLSLATQQALTLALITGGSVAASKKLEGEDLNLRFGEDPALSGVPMCPELESAEDRLVAHLEGILPPEAEPNLLLFGPGLSKTDPLYALRFLAKLGLKTGRAGGLTVYERRANPSITRYYAGLPWGLHRLDLALGKDFEQLRGGAAHMILAIHPSTFLNTLFGLFAENLVSGGIGLVQATVNQEFAEEEYYHLLLDMALAPYKGIIEFLEPPYRSRLFRSYFSDRPDRPNRPDDIHVLMVRKK